ncbi:related to TAF5-subunit of TFIID and SAGA complexes [Sporisorium reilianum f. sp. reilianum]|uniref:WD40 repeat-containing protein SMU1 n=1 Tax=Sporisorium reilianum f. sp. reilianum TaxID=72559 RepID=A0A2N8UIA8_9BASI|nr:related to TAF5-subunit of TFIID and SAGA complexes [Sporisorium reilianum f. sp. reilianum]
MQGSQQGNSSHAHRQGHRPSPPTQITVTAASGQDPSNGSTPQAEATSSAQPSPVPLTPRASTFQLPSTATSSAADARTPSATSLASMDPNAIVTSGSYTAPASSTVASSMLRSNTIGATAPAASTSNLDRSASAHPDLAKVNGLGISTADAGAASSSGTGSVNGVASTSGGTKETWKRRKQVLLADAKDHTVADLQLHGLRPPPYVYHPYYQNSSILGQTVGQLTAHTASTSRDTNPNQATYASSRTAILRPDDAQVRNDIIRMIDQWLADEGFGATRQLLMEEAGIKRREREEAGLDARKLRGHILEGDWPEVDKLLQKPLVKNHKAFLYAVYKQQFLEHIEHREFQKGFTFLNKRLKPLEHYQPHPSEYRDLCYLLSAKAVTDAPSFATWEGIQPGREKLVMEFAAMLEQDWMEKEAGLPGSASTNGNSGRSESREGSEMMDDGMMTDSVVAGGASKSAAPNGYTYVPPHRLLTMLHQAVAYQVEFARYHPKKAPVISGLLHDYTGFIVPNSVAHTMRGHRKNVKSVRFVGEEGRKLVSGSSDNTVRLWNSNTGRCEGVLEGHRSRVWDVDSTRTGGHVASASGDSTVKVWDVESAQCRTTLRAGMGDVYSCRFHPDEKHMVAAGYDKLVRMYDVETGSIVKTFTGHQLGVSSAIFNPLGNLIVTASKDTTIRFWDVVSGLCIRTITGHLGEVTSVEINETGTLLLSSSKDNSNRLWDLRMLRPLKRFKGHQNTSKNFIRSSFAHTSLLVGGSEDGLIYMWDQESSEVLQTLEGHGRDTLHPAHKPTGSAPATTAIPGSFVSDLTSLSTNNNVAYGAVWNKAQSLLASCGDDGTVKTWIWDEGRDLEANADLARRADDG